MFNKGIEEIKKESITRNNAITRSKALWREPRVE